MPTRTLLVALLLLAACAQPEEPSVTLDEEAAQGLAQGAQRLAGALDEGDACAAMAEADAVAAQARDGVASGTVPTDVANEVEAVVTEVTEDLSCDADASTDEDEDDANDGDGEREPEPEPEPDPEPDPEPEAPEDDDPGGGPDDDGPPGGGPDGDGPPGQAQGDGSSGDPGRGQ